MKLREMPSYKVGDNSNCICSESFEVHLFGHKITVLTDHQAQVSGYLSYIKDRSK